MSVGYRTQLAQGMLKEQELPLEGEPRWDPIYRKLGFWNFAEQQMNWFRIPTAAEGENYVPQHQWSGTRLRFKNADGTWGDYSDLGSVFSDISVVTNSDGSLTFNFTSATEGGSSNFQVTTGSVSGPPGPVPVIGAEISDDGIMILSVEYEG